MKNNQQMKTRHFILLHIGFFMLSIVGILSKTASSYYFMSKDFILFYGLAIVIIILYTLIWQQVLKRMKLTTAYYNKSITIIWGMIFGKIIFGEQIKATMIIGAIIVVVGIVLVVTATDSKNAGNLK